MHLVRLLAAISTLLIFGCSFELDEAMEKDSATDEQAPGTWVQRDSDRPNDRDEQLAIQVVRNAGKRLQQPGRTAVMFYESPPTSIVMVESTPGGNDPLTKVILYHLEGEIVVSVTTPQFIDKKKEEDMEKRRQAAREVAYQAKNRTLPMMPLLWWGKYTYTPEISDGCRITIVEKNTYREETGSFEIDVCKDENAK